MAYRAVGEPFRVLTAVLFSILFWGCFSSGQAGAACYRCEACDLDLCDDCYTQLNDRDADDDERAVASSAAPKKRKGPKAAPTVKPDKPKRKHRKGPGNKGH